MSYDPPPHSALPLAALGLQHIVNKGNNKITELREILQRESQNSYVYKHTKTVNNRKTVKTVMTLNVI
jgi:hypothetical protein